MNNLKEQMFHYIHRNKIKTNFWGGVGSTAAAVVVNVLLLLSWHICFVVSYAKEPQQQQQQQQQPWTKKIELLFGS